MNEHDAIHELLTLAAAGALDAGEQGRVEEHLRQCEACRVEFAGWLRLTGALKDLPTPQAPPTLVEQTRRAMEIRAAAQRGQRTNHLMLGLMLLVAWTVTLLNWPLLQLLEGSVTQWLHVSSGQLTAAWASYMLLAWLATALAAGLLGQRRQREGATL
jgi:anti-sigma factor RsiW